MKTPSINFNNTCFSTINRKCGVCIENFLVLIKMENTSVIIMATA